MGLSLVLKRFTIFTSNPRFSRLSFTSFSVTSTIALSTIFTVRFSGLINVLHGMLFHRKLRCDNLNVSDLEV